MNTPPFEIDNTIGWLQSSFRVSILYRCDLAGKNKVSTDTFVVGFVPIRCGTGLHLGECSSEVRLASFPVLILCNRWMIIRFEFHLLTFRWLLSIVLLLTSVLLLVCCSVPITFGWSVRAQGSVRTVGMPRGVEDSVVVWLSWYLGERVF